MPEIIIKNFVGYVCGGFLKKPNIGDMWDTQLRATLICKTENHARKMSNQAKIWTHVYQVTGLDISVEDNGEFWSTNQPNKLKVEKLVYQRTLETKEAWQR